MPQEAGCGNRRRPSAAMVVAVAALVVALAGTAIAASGPKLSKREKRQVRAISTALVGELASGLSVAHAQTAGSAQSSQSAQNADALDGQDSTAFLPSGAVLRIPTTQMVDQQEINPIDLPNVDVFFQCGIDDAGQDVVFAEVAFASAGSLVFGGNTSVAVGGSTFPVFQQTHPATGSNRMSQSQVSIVSDEGTTLTGTVWTAFNLDGTSDRCFVGGHLVSSG